MSTELLTKEEQEVIEINEAVEESLKTKVSFKIQTSLFQSLVAQVERATAKGSTDKEIIKGIYIYVEGTKMLLRAINDDFGVQIEVKQEKITEGKRKVNNFEITDGKSGGFVVLHKNFKAMVNKLPRTFATFEVEGSTALIKSGSAKYKLAIIDGAEFPSLPEVEDKQKISVHPGQLSNLYTQVIHSVATKHDKVVLTGVNHLIEDDKLFIISTDGHQLARRVIELDDETKVEGDVNFTIPASSLDEVMKQCKDSESVTLYIDNNSIVYEFDNTIMYSRLFKEKFPSVSKMIPKEFATEVRFLSKDLKAMLERSMLLCQSNSNSAAIRTIPKLKQLRLSSNESEIGSFEEDLGATEAAGSDIHIGVSLRFLTQAIKSYGPNDLLKIQLISSLKPFVISRADQTNDDNLNFILPVRLNEYDKVVTIKDFSAQVQIEADYDYEGLTEDEEVVVEKETPKEVVVEKETPEEVVVQETTTKEVHVEEVTKEEVVVEKETELTPEILEEMKRIQSNPFANIQVESNTKNAFVQED